MLRGLLSNNPEEEFLLPCLQYRSLYYVLRPHHAITSETVAFYYKKNQDYIENYENEKFTSIRKRYLSPTSCSRGTGCVYPNRKGMPLNKQLSFFREINEIQSYNQIQNLCLRTCTGLKNLWGKTPEVEQQQSKYPATGVLAMGKQLER
ncbi:hypothetical protein ACFS7Z_15705 [Pontibacter toksunensis]|uniref:Uncharacterized protein n=1 Tax=Pontibacter toksunensis TaxID=1332631 RepID=A0ABW6BZK0_9BACT